MSDFRVVVSERAKSQVWQQVLYIAEDSVDRALAWEERVIIAMQAIGKTRGGHAVDDEASNRFGEEVHKVPFERTYLIFYTVDRAKRRITVASFRHGARRKNEEER